MGEKTNKILGFDVQIEVNGCNFLFRTMEEAVIVADGVTSLAQQTMPCARCRWDPAFGKCIVWQKCDQFNSEFEEMPEEKPVDIEEKLFQLRCPECGKNFFMRRKPVADEWKESFICQYCSQYIVVAMPNRHCEEKFMETIELIRDNLACPMCEHFEVCGSHPIPMAAYQWAGNGRRRNWDVHHAYAMNCRYFKFDIPTTEGSEDE